MIAEPNPAAATEIVNRFVAAINDHEVETLASLMTDEHLFVDSVGNQVRGAHAMKGGWRGYFALCPDYAIHVSELLAEPYTVIATGEASGTIDGIAWRTLAAWLAKIRDGQIAEWRVFADNKPVYEILARRAG